MSNRREFEWRAALTPRSLSWSFLLGLLLSTACGQAQALSEAELALKTFQVADGLRVDLFAAEPMLQNPVAFSIDEKGRVFVAETHRYRDAVFDITRQPGWLADDLAFRTVAERSNFLDRTFATNRNLLTRDSELIRLLEDTNTDGKADASRIFADGFRESVAGPAAGVLAVAGSVWFACVPDLWRLDDNPALSRPIPPAPTKRQRLHTGFGVHIGVSGHDLHGLVFGPDGKIYFSMGDRGFEPPEGLRGLGFTTNFLRRVLPDTGSVLRCNPDGSELEVFALGLRNPQELAFDGLGNLFTVDNDTAGSDESRVLHVVEGGDYGWRTSYQHMEHYGPWVIENVWRGWVDDVLPPAGIVAQGPSGLAFNPGTALGQKYEHAFLVCDFPGGIWAFKVRPHGSSFVVAWKEKMIWNLWPTDIAIAGDGSVLVSDWTEGWSPSDKGRLYRIRAKDPAHAAPGTKPSITPADGIATAERRSSLGLITPTFSKVDMPRLKQLTQAADLGIRFAASQELARMDNFRALSNAEQRELLANTLACIRSNAGEDPFLTHSGVIALTETADLPTLRRAASDPSAAVKRAVLLAYRRLESPQIDQFLSDPDLRLRYEAARAIHDAPIPGAMPELAKMIGRIDCPSNILGRAINACFRLGTEMHAKMLASYSARLDAPEWARAEALMVLGHWKSPPAMDRVVGLWRPLPSRSEPTAKRAFLSVGSQLLKSKSAPLQLAVARTAVRLRAKEAAHSLFEHFINPSTPLPVRRELPRTLVALFYHNASEAVRLALTDPDPLLRREGMRLVGRAAFPSAANQLERMLQDENELASKQTAMLALGDLASGEADAALLRQFQKLSADKLEPELHLELFEALQQRENPALKSAAQDYSNNQPVTDRLRGWREATRGGDAEAGRKVFFERVDADCARCHKSGGAGGTLGPDLTGIGKRLTPDQLLESILFPNQNLAPGFENATLTLKDGRIVAGTVQRETGSQLTIHSPEEGVVVLEKDRVASRRPGLSAMPDGIAQRLSKRDLRDLVAFLQHQ